MTQSTMEIDPGSAEAIFAQKLASCEPKIRTRALVKLRQWMQARVGAKEYFTRDDLLKLWKGLYYSLWMQDKPLLQEELVDGLCSLDAELGRPTQILLNVDVGIATLIREWPHLDRWRVDKFLMLLRRLFRSSLTWLASAKKPWSPQWAAKLVDILRSHLLSTQSDACPEELKMSFAGMFLDELDLAGKTTPLDTDTLHLFLQPAVDVVASSETSEQFFRTIVKEIFEVMLLQASDDANRAPSAEAEEKGFEIDYGKLADVIFAASKAKGLKATRRKILYGLVSKLRTAATGGDPLDEGSASDGGSDVDMDEEIEKAAERLARRSQVKKRKRPKNLPDPDKEIPDAMIQDDEDSDEEVKPTPRKQKRVVHKAHKKKPKAKRPKKK